jgi:hypothetical protein
MPNKNGKDNKGDILKVIANGMPIHKPIMAGRK